MSFALAFLGFAALIILHEAGHFVAAKAVGMRVERFSLFFGPMFLKRTIGETEYGIGVIPLGGYVKITGMSPEEAYLPVEDEGLAAEPATPASGLATAMSPLQATPAIPSSLTAPPERILDDRAYVNQPVWKRIVVILAGPFVNLVIAFVLLFAVIMGSGILTTGNGNWIEALDKGSPAANILKPGDKLISVDGRTTEKGIIAAISATHCAGGATTNGCVTSPAVRMTVKRDGKLLTFSVHARYSTVSKRPLVGFSMGNEYVAYQSAGSAVGWTFRAMGSEIGHTASVLGHIFQAKDRKQLHSFVGIYDLTEQSIQYSPSQALEILALVSLALGIFNLLPFLPLDGGHIFWAITEKLRGGKKMSLATMERASFIGIALMLCLFAIGFSNDISGLANGTLHLH